MSDDDVELIELTPADSQVNRSQPRNARSSRVSNDSLDSVSVERQELDGLIGSCRRGNSNHKISESSHNSPPSQSGSRNEATAARLKRKSGTPSSTASSTSRSSSSDSAADNVGDSSDDSDIEIVAVVSQKTGPEASPERKTKEAPQKKDCSSQPTQSNLARFLFANTAKPNAAEAADIVNVISLLLDRCSTPPTLETPKPTLKTPKPAPPVATPPPAKKPRIKIAWNAVKAVPSNPVQSSPYTAPPAPPPIWPKPPPLANVGYPPPPYYGTQQTVPLSTQPFSQGLCRGYYGVTPTTVFTPPPPLPKPNQNTIRKVRVLDLIEQEEKSEQTRLDSAIWDDVMLLDGVSKPSDMKPSSSLPVSSSQVRSSSFSPASRYPIAKETAAPIPSTSDVSGVKQPVSVVSWFESFQKRAESLETSQDDVGNRGKFNDVMHLAGSETNPFLVPFVEELRCLQKNLEPLKRRIEAECKNPQSKFLVELFGSVSGTDHDMEQRVNLFLQQFKEPTPSENSSIDLKRRAVSLKKEGDQLKIALAERKFCGEFGVLALENRLLARQLSIFVELAAKRSLIAKDHLVDDLLTVAKRIRGHVIPLRNQLEVVRAEVDAKAAEFMRENLCRIFGENEVGIEETGLAGIYGKLRILVQTYDKRKAEFERISSLLPRIQRVVLEKDRKIAELEVQMS